MTLEPCPFCGATPKLVEENLDGPAYWSIACDNDDCASRPTLVHTDKHNAIAAWNTRHRSSPSSAWRDIKDAPKDKAVLVYGSDGIDMGHWDDALDEWHRICTADYDNEYRRISAPTHYMPLPEPPK